MQTLRRLQRARQAPTERRGAALLMAFLVIVVIILIAGQISRATSTNSRVARNEEILLSMDLAIESALLQVHEDLRSDAESGAGGAGAGGGDAAAVGALTGGGAPGGAGEGGEGQPASDSREDDWARPQRTEVNGIRLRILIQDEDSKFNVLSILTEDEDEAEKAFDRLVRVLDYARGDTGGDIDGGEARAMADKIRTVLEQRRETYLPQPSLLSDDPENENQSLLFSLRELVGLEEFHEDLFRDYRDERGVVVHSLESFLTLWSSLTTFDELGSRGASSGGQQGAAASGGSTTATSAGGDGEGGQDEGDGGGEGGDSGSAGEGGLAGQSGEGGQAGGAPSAGIEPVSGAINVNTAPAAVLKALFDDRDVPLRFWDEVIEYRNEEDEDIEENDDPPLDEYGEEIVIKQFFDSLDELTKLDGWNDLEPIYQGELQQLVTTQSNVFSIYVTARKLTGVDSDAPPPSDRRELVEQETNGTGLVRTVRQVVWRKVGSDGTVEIVPIVRWEVIDHVPYEVLDYPDEDR